MMQHFFCFSCFFPERNSPLNISQIYQKAIFIPVQNPHIAILGVASHILSHMNDFTVSNIGLQLVICQRIQHKSVKCQCAKIGMSSPGWCSGHCFRRCVNQNLLQPYLSIWIQLSQHGIIQKPPLLFWKGLLGILPVCPYQPFQLRRKLPHHLSRLLVGQFLQGMLLICRDLLRLQNSFSIEIIKIRHIPLLLSLSREKRGFVFLLPCFQLIRRLKGKSN